MKKIPTMFERVFAKKRIVDITPNVTEGCRDALEKGVATIKIDGSCCAVIGGVFYKRFDAKKGRTAPNGAIPCCDPDPITGHHPHWVAVSEDDPSDKYFLEALRNTPEIKDGTYEAIGPKIQGNPYGLCAHILEPHGMKVVEVERTFEGIRQYLTDNNVEGLVFWLNGEPVCKIKRSDFGLKWPEKE